jgi:hypothetical protein
MSNEAITEMLEFVGVLFFVRGVALMSLSSSPDTQHGMRGLVFAIMGVFTINFPATFKLIQNTIENFVSGSHTLSPIQQTISSLIPS